jgi:hypothetical protein
VVIASFTSAAIIGALDFFFAAAFAIFPVAFLAAVFMAFLGADLAAFLTTAFRVLDFAI